MNSLQEDLVRLRLEELRRSAEHELLIRQIRLSRRPAGATVIHSLRDLLRRPRITVRQALRLTRLVRERA